MIFKASARGRDDPYYYYNMVRMMTLLFNDSRNEDARLCELNRCIEELTRQVDEIVELLEQVDARRDVIRAGLDEVKYTQAQWENACDVLRALWNERSEVEDELDELVELRDERLRELGLLVDWYESD